MSIAWTSSRTSRARIIPRRSTFRDTALGSAYNCGNVVRVICVDNAAVNAVLSRSVPIEARDLVIVLVNDPEYGGSGGPVIVASALTATVEIALHESGHTFGRLADEYDLPPPPCTNTLGASRKSTRRWTSAGIGSSGPTGWRRPRRCRRSSGENGIPGAYQGARHCVSWSLSADRQLEDAVAWQTVRASQQ